MFLKIFSGIFLLANCVFLSFGLDETFIELLTSLQSDHYGYVKTALDTTEELSTNLYFVDDDLMSNAEHYFNNLAFEELEQLAPLKEGCGQDEACLTCFDTEPELTKIALNVTSQLLQYFEKQKRDFDSTISDIKSNLRDSALLSTVVYALYRDSTDFETNARNYYERIRKALVYESDLFNQTVKATISKLVKYSIDATVEATDQLQNIFDTIVECAEQNEN